MCGKHLNFKKFAYLLVYPSGTAEIAGKCRSKLNLSLNITQIRTYHQQKQPVVIGSDYMFLVPKVGFEPTRYCYFKAVPLKEFLVIGRVV